MKPLFTTFFLLIPLSIMAQSEVQEIKKTLIEMWDAIEKNDPDRYARYIHPDFTQFGETDAILLEGKTAEVESIKNWLQNSSDIHTEMIDPKVTVKGDVAWMTYYWSDKGLTSGQVFTSKGKSTRIFVKENNQWRCIHGHYTLLPD
ncbi:MAG: nuclear transport factor 2 family protein [Lutimonas sp.]|jgi:ketosteroid isomerase-like protein